MNGSVELILHGYWRSSASYRVRIALNLKNVPYRQVTYDLRTGAQRDAAYLALAPHGLVPALEHERGVLIESPAILEWIDGRWPEPALLPADLDSAAVVRAMAALIACDIHPLNNLRVLNRLRESMSASEDQIRDWIAHWTEAGFAALEQMVQNYGGHFAFGDSPTLADCYLVPQVYNARRFGIDLSRFPRLTSISGRIETLPAFSRAVPESQPDADA